MYMRINQIFLRLLLVSSYHWAKPFIKSSRDKSMRTFPSSFLSCEMNGLLFFTAMSSVLFLTFSKDSKNSNFSSYWGFRVFFFTEVFFLLVHLLSGSRYIRTYGSTPRLEEGTKFLQPLTSTTRLCRMEA